MSFRHVCFNCGGQGWHWDPCDSGSGATVYCDCPEGKKLATVERHAHVVGIYPNVPSFKEVQEYNAARRVVAAELPS